MRRPRFRIRALMIAVAALGVVLGEGISLWNTRAYRLRMATRHREIAQQEYRVAVKYPPAHPIREQRAVTGLLHGIKGEMYDLVARRPWLAMPLDLPPRWKRVQNNATIAKALAQPLPPDPPPPE